MTEAKNPVALFRGDLTAMQSEFAKALPAHLPAERFVRTTMTAIQNNPDILNCTRQSVLSACMKAAQDGLVLDGREAALVERKSNGTKLAVYTPMVAGITKLVRNSGQLASLTAQVVYERDSFSYNPADDAVPDHKPDWFGQRGKPIGVYAVAKLKDGTCVVEVMSKDEVIKIGNATPNKHQYAETGQHYGEWWRKTVIRRISKYLPKSTDRDDDARVFQAIERDDEEYEFEDVKPTPASRRKPRAADILNTVDVNPDTGEVIDQQGVVTDAEVTEVEDVI